MRGQKHRVRGEHHDGLGRAQLPRQPLDRRPGARRQLQVDPAGPQRHRPRTGGAARQIQGSRLKAGQLPTPELDARCARFWLGEHRNVLSQPGTSVPAVGEPVVRLDDVGEQHPAGEGVVDQVVKCEADGLAVGPGEQPGAQHRPTVEAERAGHEVGQYPVGIGVGPEHLNLDRHLLRRQDAPHDVRSGTDENRTQRVVAREHDCQGRAQDHPIQFARHREGQRKIVRRAAWRRLPHQPEGRFLACSWEEFARSGADISNRAHRERDLLGSRGSRGHYRK